MQFFIHQELIPSLIKILNNYNYLRTSFLYLIISSSVGFMVICVYILLKNYFIYQKHLNRLHITASHIKL